MDHSGFQFTINKPGIQIPPLQFEVDHPFSVIIALNGAKATTFGALFAAKVSTVQVK